MFTPKALSHIPPYGTHNIIAIWFWERGFGRPCLIITSLRSLNFHSMALPWVHFVRMHSSRTLWVGRRSRLSCMAILQLQCISFIKKVQKGKLISLFIKMGQCGAFSRTAIGRAGISEWGYWLVSKAWSLSLANCLVLYLGRKACTLLNEARESYYHSKLNRMALQECFLHNRVHTE